MSEVLSLNGFKVMRHNAHQFDVLDPTGEVIDQPTKFEEAKALMHLIAENVQAVFA